MRAVVIETPEKFAVQNVPDPTPGPGEVVVRVDAVGVCGTDAHIADGEFPPTPYPIVPGHEFAGSVVALGTGVDGVRIGDAIAVDPSLFCGACHYCAVGRGNLCERWGTIGDTVDGAMAEYVAVPAANCYRLPETLSTMHGALVGPLSCAVHAFDALGAHYLLYGVIDANAMITHSFGLAEFADALQTFRAGTGRKIQLRPGA